MDIDTECANLIKALDFLPYPFLLSAHRDGVRQNIYVNSRFNDELGYTREEIPTIEDWFVKAYPDAEYRRQVILDWQSKVECARQPGVDSVVTQARIHTRHYGAKWYEVKASVIGPINFVVFVNIDQEIRREEELERLSENKNRILSILSHDLRAPLNSLGLTLGLAAHESLTRQEENEILKRISHQVFQLTELLDTTLQWSRSNFAGIQLQSRIVGIKPILIQYLELYNDAIQEKKINVIDDIDSNDVAASDSEIISIVLRNLISNAIKYTPTGGIIRIGSTVRNGIFGFIVSNSGNGISEKKISQILTRKYSSDPGTNNEKGLGLGLSLCQQLLDRVGGKLEIENSLSGALFRVMWGPVPAHALVS